MSRHVMIVDETGSVVPKAELLPQHQVTTLVSASAAASVNGTWVTVSPFALRPMGSFEFSVSGGTLTVEGTLDQVTAYTVFTTTGAGTVLNQDLNSHYIRATKTSAANLGYVKARFPQ